VLEFTANRALPPSRARSGCLGARNTRLRASQPRSGPAGANRGTLFAAAIVEAGVVEGYQPRRFRTTTSV